jgi:hypothetical protein
MEQMNVSEEQKVRFDFSPITLPGYVREFQPLLFKDGETFVAVLGPDLQTGITGKGNSPEEALLDWNKNIKERLRKADDNDSVTQFVMDSIHTHKKDIW